ncbi:hypothetical protein [Rickettsia endosymbiont of Halotydeus destructor]|uniref:hypothetical protein n=1 Tax=Rickettsia endosymbiont of Halotydeus destructor TaxID=2996754 RepID=UPI003BAFE245
MIELFERFANDNTEMYFDDRTPVSFKNTIEKLCKNNSPAEAQQKILTSLQAYVAGNANNENMKEIKHFHDWALNIHNSHLIAPPEGGWPNNIFFRILLELRTLNSADQLNPQEILMLCMMEGINGRKINKGETPTTDFISTTLATQVVKAVNTLGIEDEKSQIFKQKYVQNSSLVKQYKSFMQGYEAFKNSQDSLIGYLAAKDALELEHTKNPNTGANAYLPKTLAPEFLSQLDSVQIKASEVTDFLNKQADEFKELIPNIGKNRISKSEELLLWDLSEYVEKIVVALKLANIDNLDMLLSKPFVEEIITRNKTGNYPVANERAMDLKELEQVTTIFQQEEIHDYNEPGILGNTNDLLI